MLIRLFRSSVVVFLLLCATHLLRAQNNAGITGQVTDTTGASIPGVQVTVVDVGSGLTFKQVTDSKGSYLLPNVPPGQNYRISFTHAGFATFTVDHVSLQVGISRTQNATLQAGATEEVTVSGANSEQTINTVDASIGENIDVRLLNELPIQDRSSGISTLFVLQPGVDPSSGSVTGARTDQSEVTLDGMDENDIAAGTNFSLTAHAPVDSVEEFRGVVAGLPLNVGTGSGGQFQLVTKSGTNHFHGNLNEYNRNTDTEANPWIDNNLGLPRAPYVRNQFGGNIGGPILRNKAFFFFDFNDSRIAQATTVDETVPLDSFRSGNVNYVLATSSTNGAACPDSSRLVGPGADPSCIGTLDSTQVQGLDPAGIGFDQSLLAFINANYPHANDFTGGDGVNTAGYAFTTGIPDNRIDYVGRVDYDLTSKQRIFGRVSIGRENLVYTPPAYPNLPPGILYTDRSYGYVVSHIWEIGDNKVNQFYYGDTIAKLQFNTPNNPAVPNELSFSGISGPYDGLGTQQRRVPLPEVRDDFNWQKGSHNINLGGTFKFIKTNSELVNNYNFLSVGQAGSALGGGLEPSVRPGDIGQGPDALNEYDSLFSLALGVIGTDSRNFDYNNSGQAVSQGSGAHRAYRFFETELYVGDSWKVTPRLTMSYGVRYQLYSVPYEVHGDQSAAFIQGQKGLTSFNQYFYGNRVPAAQQMLSGNAAVPLLSYELAGKANKGPAIYSPSYKDFAPRVAFAYRPSWTSKTVFNFGAGLVYDRTVINAVNFIQDQSSYLFQNNVSTQFGATGPAASLATDPRLSISSSGTVDPTLLSAILPPAPTITPPVTPYVDSTGTPYGLAASAFNTIIDPTLKDPYSISMNVGLQQELPNHFLLKMNYDGRLGRRLLAQADASQIIDNADPVSSQLMSAAFAGLETQTRNGGVTADPVTGLPVATAQPWFENVLGPNTGASYGFANNTSLVAYLEGILVNRGDMADMVESLAYYGLLPTNVGMDSQFSENTFVTNKGSSAYHALLVTLDRNLAQGLQFEFNYTWSHSIDNTSLVANSIASSSGVGFVCDATRPRECRGNSDFDIQQVFNGNFLYDLPFGHGRAFGGGIPGWLNEAIGGWTVSGIPIYRSGTVMNVFSDAYVAGYANDAPAIFVGQTKRDLRSSVNKQNGNWVDFKDPLKVFSDFVGPTGLQIGQRNDFRGPGSFSFDAGVAKTFAILPNDRLNLKFRADAFNVFNHPTFATPGLNIASSQAFGKITGGAGGYGAANYAPRVLQAALRLEF